MKFLNYILIAYFSIGACIPRCDFSQMGQLNNLLEHYKLHQKEAIESGLSISFNEFLYIHFVEGDEHQHQNENEHQNLPLYSISGGILLFLDQVDYAINTVSTIIQEREITFQIPFYINPFINQVFHPPSHFID